MSQVSTTLTANGKGRFGDKITVHTAPSGTQYVHLIDVFFSEEEIKGYIAEARAKSRSTKSTVNVR